MLTVSGRTSWKGFHPDSPQDASWGERYFHMPDPDGHELFICSTDLGNELLKDLDLLCGVVFL